MHTQPEHLCRDVLSASYHSTDPHAPSCHQHQFVSHGTFIWPELNRANTWDQNLPPSQTAFATELRGCDNS